MTPDLTPWISANAGLASLVFARTAGLAWTAPAFATPGLGLRFRALLAAGLCLVVMPALAVPADGLNDEPWPALVRACLVEGLVGAALGWSAALVVAGARQAGEVVGAQAGLSPASLFDPEAGDGLTAVGHLYGLVALGVFLALDGPLVLVRALAGSFAVVPLGCGLLGGTDSEGVWAWGLSADAARYAFGRVGEALALCLRAAAPVALALTLAGLEIGLIGRAAPSIQRTALTVPVRAAVGLLLVLLGLAALAATLSAAWSGWPGPAPDFGRA